MNTIREHPHGDLLVAGIGIAGINGGSLGFLAGEALATAWAMVARFLARPGRPLELVVEAAARHLESLRRIGIPAVAASIALLLSLLIGQRMLTELPNGFVAVARFSVAYRWSLVVLFAPAALAPVMLPVLANLAGAAHKERSGGSCEGTSWSLH